jgi:shikimate dehydrogenase
VNQPHAVSAATRLLAILGDPIAHSLSPTLHNAVFRALGLDAVYVGVRCSAPDCAPLLLAIARAGGAGNVTLPHKHVAARTVETPSAAVRRTGACNTFWLENGRVAGDNTDIEGFRRALYAFRGHPAGARIVLLGAGGAARAVIAALVDEGVERVEVLARNPERVGQLERVAAGSRLQLQPIERISGNIDLIINATPLGIHDQDPQPYPLDELSPSTGVFDLVYRAADTSWVRAARERGLPAMDGKEMLIQQAAAAFERWWPREAPVAQMREALKLQS